MELLYIAIAALTGSACLSLALSGKRQLAGIVGLTGSVTGSSLGFVAALRMLVGGETYTAHTPWSVPYASVSLKVGLLSASFLVALFLLSLIVCLYAHGYLRSFREKSLGAHWFLLNNFIVSMALVLMADNAIFFLYAWELMSLLSFFLVTFEHENLAVRQAGFIYLIATHLGTVCLIIAFIMLGAGTLTLDFENLAAAGSTANWIFILGLVGFGTKAGIMPFHVWLPKAHPAAPSHISALMSGMMIKIGIYGLLRFLVILGEPQAWWGYLVIALGVCSGVMGVLLAVGQHDIKRLLAYSSIENIGVILMGIGLGIIGTASKLSLLAALGFAGALLHAFNHGIFKSLLFLGAGAVAQACGTRKLEDLGGLLKRMPATALSFGVGSVAICGIPPLNGFVGEFLIYLSAFQSIMIAKVTTLHGILAILFAGGRVNCFSINRRFGSCMFC